MRDQPSLNRTGQRSGMALLFVVSLILFITLLGASFVVVSQQFSSSAKNRTRIRSNGDDGSVLVSRAFYDLVRGPKTDNTDSPLLGHDLLSDMYGYGFSGSIVNPQFNANVDGAVDFNLTSPINLRDGSSHTLSNVAGAYNGQVLTITSGELRGTSLRIVGYSGSDTTVTGTAHAFTVYPEWSNGTLGAIGDLHLMGVVVNGKPFFGWGAGGLSAVPGANKLAADGLEPNQTQQPTLADALNYLSTGVNESYDAPDFQNMFLAAFDDIDGDGLIEAGEIIPSFDREELYAANPNPRRTFRPATPGHPIDANFFGNPDKMNLHVDNDGDGFNDSIWINPGMPIQTDLSGRRYQPLVAYLVLDMDSRFNVNAHGNLFDLDLDGGDGNIDRGFPSSGVPQFLLGAVNPRDLTPSTPNDEMNLPAGQALGPPDVSLAPLLGRKAADYYDDLLFERYGSDLEPGNGRIRDAWVRYELFGHPDRNHPYGEVYPNEFVGGLFGSGMDIHSRYVLGIPEAITSIGAPIGMPSKDFISDLGPEEIANSAYEFSLTPWTRYAVTVPDDVSDDRPFRPKEVERFLRQFDRDAKMLPSELFNAISPALTAADRNLLTTESWEVPSVPGLDPIVALGETPGSPVSIPVRVHNLLVANGVPPASANLELDKLVSPEIRMGLPFDINRPFGNGQDDNGNGVVDEHAESADPMLNEAARPETIFDVNGVAQPFDGNGDGIANEFDQNARAVFARHLYVLALIVTGDTDNIPAPNFSEPVDPANPNNVNTIRRKRLAQWAINVADYRDSDSIMTGFEFDVNPFNGWNVDDLLSTTDPGPERGVVWGLEHPELLISETVSFHARRSENDSQFGVVEDDSDPHYDSVLVPQATVFFELYRPEVTVNFDRLERNEFNPSAPNGNDHVDLLQESAPGSPVWRMVVSQGENFEVPRTDVPDLTDPEDQLRRIYFTRPTLVEPNSIGDRQKVYFPSDDINADLTGSGNHLMLPGQYAVIGSGGIDDGTNYRSYFGRRSTPNWNSPGELDQTRGITLVPSTGTVVVREGSPDPISTLTRPGVVAIPINRSYSPDDVTVEVVRSLGVSDPVDGYFDYRNYATELMWPPMDPDGYQFASTKDLPVDQDLTVHDSFTDSQAVMRNGMTPNHRCVFLQRLANPLLPYDPALNPYITVDMSSIDLCATNGATNDTRPANEADPNIVPNNNVPSVFYTNSRGRRQNPDISSRATAVTERRLLWPVEPQTILTDPTDVVPQTVNLADSHHFKNSLYGSLGIINKSYSHIDFTSGSFAPIGFAGLAFKNRPYANHLELSQVPYASGFELLQKYSKLKKSADNPYDEPAFGGQFGHLINFYAGYNPAMPPSQSFTQGMYRLLDFVRVPSRFAGNKIHLDPASGFLPPFNQISRYREPGKININTTTNQKVWNGWLGQFSSTINAEGQFVDGTPTTYTMLPVNKMDFEASRRTMGAFTNPVRNANDFDKVPDASRVPTDPVATTLLRSNATMVPIFQQPQVLPPQQVFPFADPQRHSQFQHQALARLGNITTTRSSVFAIWITVGRFEVDENDQLTGVELGADSGKTERYRGFYMIDRSIPVAFEPGENHNINNMILIESMIK